MRDRVRTRRRRWFGIWHEIGLGGWLYVVAALFLVVAFLLVTSRPQRHLSIVRRHMTVNETTLLQNYTIDYPVFHDPQLDGIVAQYITAHIDAYEKTVAHRPDIRNHLTISFAFLHYGQRVVSVEFDVKVRQAGRPDALTRQYVTFDMASKRLVTAKDMLLQNSASRMKLAKLLHDYFRHQVSAGLSSAELVGLLELSLEDITDVYLTSNSVIIELNLHRPGNKQGKVRIGISKQVLAGILTEVYRTDKSEVTGVILASDYAIMQQPAPGDTVDPAAKILALTFDDGPSTMTNRLLDQLERYESHATFFVLGYAVDGHRGELQHTLQQGSEIGNHSWGHLDLQLQSSQGLDHQVQDTQRAIQAATGGYSPRLMRPPYGSTNAQIHQYLEEHGLRQALWNVDTRDWLDKNTELIYQRVMAGAHDGAIILLHDIHPTSVEAALRAIRDLKAEGYQLVTLSQLYQYR